VSLRELFSKPTVIEVSPEQTKMKQQAGAIILDVRERYQWCDGHIPDAINIPLGSLAKRLQELDASQEIIAVCHRGQRSIALSIFLCNIAILKGFPLLLKGGVKPFELDARISGGEAPIDGDGLRIALVLPGLDLALQFLLCPNATGKALACQSREFNLGHIQPTPMDRCGVQFQFS
jgi:rhodanese-related sulfurtransferase